MEIYFPSTFIENCSDRWLCLPSLSALRAQKWSRLSGNPFHEALERNHPDSRCSNRASLERDKFAMMFSIRPYSRCFSQWPLGGSEGKGLPEEWVAWEGEGGARDPVQRGGRTESDKDWTRCILFSAFAPFDSSQRNTLGREVTN